MHTEIAWRTLWTSIGYPAYRLLLSTETLIDADITFYRWATVPAGILLFHTEFIFTCLTSRNGSPSNPYQLPHRSNHADSIPLYVFARAERDGNESRRTSRRDEWRLGGTGGPQRGLCLQATTAQHGDLVVAGWAGRSTMVLLHCNRSAQLDWLD